MKMPEVEDVDFDRDSNQGSFMQKDTTKKGDAEQQEREKRFLMDQLKQIKD